MSKSQLLKDAIADAKAVRETAIENAKIALGEAFTPRLQSILSKKIQQEIEEEEEDLEDVETQLESEFGDDVIDEPIEAELEDELEDELEEEYDEDELDEILRELDGEDEDSVIDDTSITEEDEEDDLELESIIRELEDELEEEDDLSDDELAGIEDEIEDHEEEFHSDDADVDLEEILREMGYGDEPTEDDELQEILREMGYGEDEEFEEGDEEGDVEELEAELEEAYRTIKSLKRTINEVNLLNAKLLYTNKLFRNYDLTNEQKMKVVETLDRTSNVREVKLVFATLAESLSYGRGVQKKGKNKITESFVSSAVKSTAPRKNIINEEFNFAERWKHLANINKK